MAENDSLLNDLLNQVLAGRYNHTQAGRALYTFYAGGVDSLRSPQQSLVSLQRALAPIRGLKTKADLQRTIFEGAHSSPQVHVSIRMGGNTIFYLAIRRFLTDGDGICLVDFYQAHVFKCVQPALHGQHIPFLLVPCSILNNRIKMI